MCSYVRYLVLYVFLSRIPGFVCVLVRDTWFCMCSCVRYLVLYVFLCEIPGFVCVLV